MDKDVLDFIIIGAQKAGTTSLFKYLQPHPQIYLPPGKEAPYFSSDELFSRGWDWYLGEFFGHAPTDRLWGKATPNYMADPRAPERIRSKLPDVKLIALLRNPIERAYSQYRMALRKGYETQGFEEAVCSLLKPDALEAARNQPTPGNSYIVRGEYGRILTRFFGLFPSKHIAVYFFDELEQSPKEMLRNVLEFLEVSSDFVPPNLGAVYHKGGAGRRLPWLEDLIKVKGVQTLKNKLPLRYRQPIAYWFRQWNAIPDDGDMHILPSVQELLARHYEEDIRQLSVLLGRKSPWMVWA